MRTLCGAGIFSWNLHKGNLDDAEPTCNKSQVKKVISGVVGAASSVTSVQVANLLRLFKIPQQLYRISSATFPKHTQIYMYSQFKYSIQSHPTRSRTSDLYPPPHRTAAFDKSFAIQASSFWNPIPADIRHAQSVPSFKPLLFKHLLLSQSACLRNIPKRPV
ncbi:unnamed protein product [Nezara viridula]|uniref:Uncharacterized protein n=1 Tax=Nezara viridula TaxID=85310 RepID=A0A9P0HU69_NEZVI|nr:unnamed protein product [Nezara viridula]